MPLQAGKVLPTGILCCNNQPIILRNPHLRARLAENLVFLLRTHSTQAGQGSMLGSYQKEVLFRGNSTASLCLFEMWEIKREIPPWSS